MRGIDGAKLAAVDAFLQQSQDARADGPQIFGEQVIQLRRAAAAGAHQLAHEDVGVVRRLGDGVEVRLSVTEEATAGGAGLVADGHDARAAVREENVQHGAVERLLVAEVVIEQRLVHPGSFGDGVDAGAGQALLRKLGQRGLQDGVAAGFRLAPAAAAGRGFWGWESFN